jgi:four helix bundle protein
MATIERFEDSKSWQKARELTRGVYAASREGSFARDFGLRDQIRRAAVSVMANIAEGFERDGDKEFIQFLSTAKGSCGEVRSHLYVALDEGYVDKQQADTLMNLAVETSRMLAGFIDYLRNSEKRGRKFR